MTRFTRGSTHGRRGFTLVELLVTIAVIGILASMILGALGAVQEAARASATRATITKLDQIIMQRYESYRTRRVAMDPSKISSNGLADSAGDRLHAIWELMRYEMPQNWYEVQASSGSPVLLDTVPALARAYYSRFQRQSAAVGDPDIINDYGSAECLYMIVTMGAPEGRTMFQDREVADVDGDGLYEFIDGWGNPIQFLRWPVGFNDSDVQPNIIPPEDLDDSGTAAAKNWEKWSNYDDERTAAARNDHDPFDVLGVLNPETSPAWRTVPLIMSGGPDGILDIRAFPAEEDTSAPSPSAVQKFPFRASGYEYYTGIPDDQPVSAPSVGMNVPANEQLDHYDNIHNHRLED